MYLAMDSILRELENRSKDLALPGVNIFTAQLCTIQMTKSWARLGNEARV